VLRGWLPEEARVPVDLRVWGAGDGSARIERPGEFEVKIPITSQQPKSSEGYVALRWDAGETHQRGGAPVGLIVHSIGFEAEPTPTR
jgi:hypothetical protein